jgi:essential nuclear protein 1
LDTPLSFHKVILDPKTSQRIFELAKEQQDELEVPDDLDDVDDERKTALSQPRTHQMDIYDDDDDEQDFEGAEEVEDVEEIFVRESFHAANMQLMVE